MEKQKTQEEVAAKKKNPAKAPPPLDRADRAERTQKLVTGRVSSDDPVVAYMVDKLRQVVQEQDFVSKQLQQAEAQATQARNRLLELRGMRTKYIEDIEAFDKEQMAAEAQAVSEEMPSEKTSADQEVAA